MSEDQPARSQTTGMTASEMLLVINDIHNLALGSRLGGNPKAIMLEIEQMAEDAIARACNDPPMRKDGLVTTPKGDERCQIWET